MLRTSHLFRYLIYTLNNKKKHDGKTSFFVRGRGGGGGGGHLGLQNGHHL